MALAAWPRTAVRRTNHRPRRRARSMSASAPSATVRTRPANTTGCRSRARSLIGNVDLRERRRLRQRQRVAVAHQGHRPRPGDAQPDRRGRRAGQVPRHVRLRRAAEEPIRQLPDALQRHRHQRPHAAWHLAGADRGRKQRHEQLDHRERRGLVTAIGDAPYLDVARPSPTMGALLTSDGGPDRLGRRGRERRRAAVPQRQPSSRSARSTTRASTTTSTPRWSFDATSGPSTRTG